MNYAQLCAANRRLLLGGGALARWTGY